MATRRTTRLPAHLSHDDDGPTFVSSTLRVLCLPPRTQRRKRIQKRSKTLTSPVPSLQCYALVTYAKRLAFDTRLMWKRMHCIPPHRSASSAPRKLKAALHTNDSFHRHLLRRSLSRNWGSVVTVAIVCVPAGARVVLCTSSGPRMMRLERACAREEAILFPFLMTLCVAPQPKLVLRSQTYRPKDKQLCTACQYQFDVTRFTHQHKSGVCTLPTCSYLRLVAMQKQFVPSVEGTHCEIFSQVVHRNCRVILLHGNALVGGRDDLRFVFSTITISVVFKNKHSHHVLCEIWLSRCDNNSHTGAV